MKSNFHVKINYTTVVTLLCCIILFITSWAPYVEQDVFGTNFLHTILKYLLELCIIAALVFSFKKKTLTQVEFTILVATLFYRIINLCNNIWNFILLMAIILKR